MRISRTAGAFSVLLVLGFSGCGYPRTEVSGQVSYNGVPLAKEGGAITFLGPDNVAVNAPIDSAGRYRAKGVCIGPNKVGVSYSVAAPKATRRIPTDPEKGVAPDKTKVDSPFLTPESYALPETSGLNVVVEKKMVYNPQLEGPPIK